MPLSRGLAAKCGPCASGMPPDGYPDRPVVDQRQLDSNLAYVELARSEAAEVLGGERLELDKPGFYQAPALFLKTTNDARINREEIFGPCASVIRVEDFDEALTTANDTEFGLSAGICTGSLKHASEFRRRVEAGMVMVNLPTAGVDYHVPFGGRKARPSVRGNRVAMLPSSTR